MKNKIVYYQYERVVKHYLNDAIDTALGDVVRELKLKTFDVTPLKMEKINRTRQVLIYHITRVVKDNIKIHSDN